MLVQSVFLCTVFLCTTPFLPCMAQPPRTPDVNAQRAAMKKLEFLAGRWSGTARIWRGPGEPAELMQTEEASYKLDGLILMVEGVGKSQADGKLALQALGLISYDDTAGTYRMRAFNDGRWLESDVKLVEEGKGLRWGFALGEIRTSSVLKINDEGAWTEVAEVTVGSDPPRKFMELMVKRQK